MTSIELSNESVIAIQQNALQIWNDEMLLNQGERISGRSINIHFMLWRKEETFTHGNKSSASKGLADTKHLVLVYGNIETFWTFSLSFRWFLKQHEKWFGKGFEEVHYIRIEIISNLLLVGIKTASTARVCKMLMFVMLETLQGTFKR